MLPVIKHNAHLSAFVKTMTCIVLIGILPLFGYGTALYYTGSSGNWSTVTNWHYSSCGGTTATALPTQYDNVYLNCGYNTTITLDVAGTCNNLVVNNGVTLAVGSNNLTVSGDLNCNSNSAGTLTWGTGTITVSGNVTFGSSSGGSISAGAGYLIMNGSTKALTITNSVTLTNFKLGSNTISVSTGSATLTISGTFDMNSKTGFTHTSGTIVVSGTVANCGSMKMAYTGTPSFTYSGGGTIASGSYYNLTTSSSAASIACGIAVQVDNTFTNSTTLTGASAVGTWSRIVNANAIANSGTIGSASTYLALSGIISGGAVGGTSGINVVQNNSLAASCIAAPTVILGSKAITGLGYCYSSATSTASSVSIAGVDLSNNVTVTAPTNFEVSKDNSTFASSVSYTQSSGLVSPTSLWVRLITGLAIANYGPSNVTCASTGAATQNLSVSGSSKTVPTATASSNSPVYTTGTLSFTGGPSSMQNYLWSGPSLTGQTCCNSVQNPSIVNPYTSATGTYTLTVTNASGCTSTASTSVTVTTATNFYSKSTGNLDVLSNWGQNTDGSGTAPSNFTTAGQIFNIRNNATPTIGATWTVSGTGSRIVVGDGSNACNFTIPAGYCFTGTVDVSNNGTVSIANTTTSLITLGILNTGSTVSYTAASSQNVIAGKYYNIAINGNSVLPSGIINISNTLTTSGNPTVTGSIVVFDGTGNQTIPAMTYNNLQTQLGGTKTLGGNITLNGVLTVGNITTLNAGSNTITFADSSGHNRIVATGTFTAATSTVNYTVANDTVSAVNYYNLNLTNGSGKLANSGSIGVSNTFTTGAGTWTTTGSTILFNGVSQTIPAWSYSGLKIGSTTTASTVSLSGATTVTGTLTLSVGILNTSSNSLTITNTAATAVSTGSTTSFINGPLIRYLPSSISSGSVYYFPVGASYVYLPVTMTNIVTGATTKITVTAYNTGSGGTYDGTLSAISTSEYWDVAHDNSLKASVSLSRQSSIASNSVVAHSSTYNGQYTSVGGDANTGTNTVSASNLTTFSDVALGTGSASSNTYYYVGSGDITQTSNWGINSDGSGTHPSNFSSDNATYIVQNTAAVTIATNWTITGANTLLQIGDGTNATNVTVAAGVTLSTAGNTLLKCNSTLTTTATGVVSINGDLGIGAFVGESVSCGSGTPITVDNSGTLNVNGNLVQPANNSYSTINNTSTGTINITNGNYADGANSAFNNAGKLNLTNGSFSLAQQGVFTNLNGGNVTINNTASPQDSVLFQYLNFPSSFISDAGSIFNVIGTNLYISGSGAMPIDGAVVVDAGNLDINAGGATLNIASTGTVDIFDPTNSGKGLLNMSYGGITLNDAGNLYANGISYPSGGGSKIYVQGGGYAFIGNVGLVTNGNNNQIEVESNGTLDYCGNKTAAGDNLGTVDANGILNYALGYYTSQTPGAQGDFAVSGTQNAAFADGTSCTAAFNSMTTTAATEALPIELSYFDAKLDRKVVELAWTTKSETNNDFFTVLKSYDAETFDAIGTVAGAGTSTIQHNYSLIDENPKAGINYYKLKQTDINGAFTYSNVKSILFIPNLELSIYPIPCDGKAINISGLKDINTQIMIYSLKGQVLFSKSIFISVDIPTTIEFDNQLIPGTYFLKCISDDQSFIKRIIVE